MSESGNVSDILTIIADDDKVRTKPRTDWPIPPSIVVETSKGKYHYYWKVIANGVLVTAAHCEGLKKQIAEQFNTDAAGVQGPNRVLRVPGFPHQKKDLFISRLITAEPERQYTPAALDEAFGYEHIEPELVGNERRFLLSELSGSSNVLAKLEEKKLVTNKKLAKKILDEVQNLENEGYQFESAEASFEIMVKKVLGEFKPSFNLEKYHVNVERNTTGKLVTEATVKLTVDGVVEHVVSEGDGPVNALDGALRKSLERFYPNLGDMHLIDYKVRVVNARAGTAARVRVIIESPDGDDIWGTVGVSENIIDASWKALVDSVEYKMIKDKTK